MLDLGMIMLLMWLSSLTNCNNMILFQLGCICQDIPFQAVTIADGNHLAWKQLCKGFIWKSQGTLFTTDALLISLGSYDMVLGTQWLRALGSITWNFNNLELMLTYKGHKLCLKRIP